MTEHTTCQSSSASEDVMSTTEGLVASPPQPKRRIRKALVMSIVALMLTAGVGGGMVVTESREAAAATLAPTRVNYCFMYWDGVRWNEISGGREVLQLWGYNSSTRQWQWFDVASSPYHCSSMTSPFGDAYYRVKSISYYGNVRGTTRSFYLGPSGGTYSTGVTNVNPWV